MINIFILTINKLNDIYLSITKQSMQNSKNIQFYKKIFNMNNINIRKLMDNLKIKIMK